jgi:hypothetical protein
MSSYKSIEDGWIVYRDKDGNIKSKTKLASSSSGKDKSIAERIGYKGRKAASSAEKSYLEQGMQIVKGLFD